MAEPLVIAHPGTVSSYPPRWKLLAAFAAVYFIWGSGYLAIRVCLESFPPFLFSGIQFATAGLLMAAVAYGRGAPPPDARQWRGAFLLALLMGVAGNGGVAWAEQHVPSSLAAILISLEPLWFVLIDWLFCDGPRPSVAVTAGLAAGFGGVTLLLWPGRNGLAGELPLFGAAAVVLASLTWSAGSLYSRSAPQPSDNFLAAGMQVLLAGVILLGISVLKGEGHWFRPENVSARSVLALAYLTVLGNVVGFSAYLWLLKVTTAARVASYAYVHPVVATFLGWSVGGESVTGRTLVGGGMLVAAVALIVTARSAPEEESSDPGG